VGKGIDVAIKIIVSAGDIGILEGVTFGLFKFVADIPYGTPLRDALYAGNTGVYKDIYWQHLAYSSKGIEEMKRLTGRGELAPELFRAWSLIDKGEVWAGNEALLRYEQETTLQKGVYDKNVALFRQFSKLSAQQPNSLISPIPGDSGSFQKIVPNGQLGDFKDRWKWISESMLPAWRKLSTDSPAKVKADMEALANAPEYIP
jgi:hypothetical protein